MTENNIRYRKRVIRRQYNLTNDDNNNNDDSSSSLNNEQQQQQQRMTYVRNKSGGLICSICDGPAHGYNFDTITCESCKAFFRRNALRNDVCEQKKGGVCVFLTMICFSFRKSSNVELIMVNV